MNNGLAPDRKNMTVRDVTGFYAFFSAWEIGQFSPYFGADFPLYYTENLEEKRKITGENSKKSSGDDDPKLQISVPCRGRTCPELHTGQLLVRDCPSTETQLSFARHF